MRFIFIALACFIASISASPISKDALLSVSVSKNGTEEENIPVEVKPVELEIKVSPKKLDINLADASTTTVATTTTTVLPSTTNAIPAKVQETTVAKVKVAENKNDSKVKEEKPAESKVEEVKTPALASAKESNAEKIENSEENKPSASEVKPSSTQKPKQRGRARFQFGSQYDQDAKSAEKLKEEKSQKPTEKVTEKPTEKTTVAATEKVTEKATEKPNVKTVATTVAAIQNVTEKATENPTEEPKEISEENESSQSKESPAKVKGRADVPTPEDRRKGKKYHDIQIVKLESELAEDGKYNYNFENEDGTLVNQEGELKKMTIKNEKGEEMDEQMGESVKGSYSYKDDDGQTYSVSYTADENGYRPVGDHIPTIPPYIARALAWSATAKPWTDPWVIQQRKLKAARSLENDIPAGEEDAK